MNDLLAGTCQMMFDGMGTSAAHIAAGRLKPLAVTVLRRSSLFPDISTMEEAGGPRLDAGTWYALWVRQACRTLFSKALRRDVKTALATPDLAKIWKSRRRARHGSRGQARRLRERGNGALVRTRHEPWGPGGLKRMKSISACRSGFRRRRRWFAR